MLWKAACDILFQIIIIIIITRPADGRFTCANKRKYWAFDFSSVINQPHKLMSAAGAIDSCHFGFHFIRLQFPINDLLCISGLHENLLAQVFKRLARCRGTIARLQHVKLYIYIYTLKTSIKS